MRAPAPGPGPAGVGGGVACGRRRGAAGRCASCAGWWCGVCPCTQAPASVLAAATGGHTDTVCYLHEECGQELSAEVLMAAAGSGSMPLVGWLLDRGCPTDDPRAYEEAAARRALELVAWMAVRHGDVCPWADQGPTCGCTCPSNSCFVHVRQDDVQQAVRGLLHLGMVLGAACGRA